MQIVIDAGQKVQCTHSCCERTPCTDILGWMRGRNSPARADVVHVGCAMSALLFWLFLTEVKLAAFFVTCNSLHSLVMCNGLY